jgi:diguanylate cyclase (GGDEF)-like protein
MRPLFRKILVNLRIVGVEASIKAEIKNTNTYRILFASAIASLIHLFFICYIFAEQDLMTNHVYWLTCIVSHSTMLFIMATLGVVVLISRKRNINNNSIINTLFYGVILLYICMGALITLLSNWMYPNLSAYVILSIGVSVFFIANPIISTVYNIVVYAVFVYMLQFFQSDSLMLITERNNSVAAVIVSITVSFILWQYNVKIIEQKKIIEEQNIELKDQNKINEHLATHDALTGILNRTHFQHLGNLEIQRLKQLKGNMSLIIADIDYFKNINDKYGHPVGDDILKEFSDLLVKNTRKTDIVARLGGEEFVILLPDMSIEEAKEKAETLRKKIENQKFKVIPDNNTITASFGVVSIDSFEDDPLIVGYKNADSALYKAKQKGRNSVAVY